MLHFTYSVRMVVGIGIYFRARGLSAGSMCMCHTRRLVGESINRTCDVVTTEQVVLHKHGRTGRRILTRILPLQGQPSQTVVQIIHIGNVIQIGSARAVKHPESTDVVLHDLHRILHLIDLKNYPNIQNIAYLMLG